MKNIPTKRKISFIILGFVILIIAYIGFNIYQTNQMAIIPIEEMDHLEVSADVELNAETKITGTVDLDNFEAVALMNRIVVDDTLYLIIYKWPAFIQDDTIDFNLENTEGLEKVERISVVYGDIYSGEGTSKGISYQDLVKHPNQRVIWEEKGGIKE